MLINGVMSAVKSSGADVHPLLVGDFFRADQTRCVASARRRYCGIKRMREKIAQGNPWRSAFKAFTRQTFEHSGLIGHGRRLFYTDTMPSTHWETYFSAYVRALDPGECPVFIFLPRWLWLQHRRTSS